MPLHGRATFDDLVAPGGIDRDHITVTTLLGASRSEHSAQSEVLDMQEARGSSPLPPTKNPDLCSI